MDTVSFIRPASPPKALHLLLDQVLAGGDAVLIAEADDGHALLDEAAAQLAARRHRVLRAAAAGPGGLNVAGLMAQVAGQSDLGVQDDAVLERGFRALTTLDETCTGIALLVSGADALHRKALRYLQFACGAGASLRLVLAGEPGLMEVLDWDEAGFLRTRLAAHPVIAVEAPEPAVAAPAVDIWDIPAPDAPVRLQAVGAAPRRGRMAFASAGTRQFASRAARGLAAAAGLAAFLGFGVEASRHGWPALHPAPADGVAPPVVAQAAPPAPPAVPPVPAGAPSAGRATAGRVTAMPDRPAPDAAAPSSLAQLPAGPAAVAPDRAASAGPSAPQPAVQDAPARPARTEAGLMASLSANPDHAAPAPGAASPAEPAAADPGVQQAAVPAVSTASAADAVAAALPAQPAPLAHAAQPALDGAGAALASLPRARRREAPRQEDAPPREMPRGGEAQEASRRDIAATPRSPARTANLRARGFGDRGFGDRGFGDRGFGDRGFGDRGFGDPDELPLPPPPARRLPRAASRLGPPGFRAPDSRVFEPGPPEAEEGGQSYSQPSSPSYIGTFGTDSNGLRTFRLDR